MSPVAQNVTHDLLRQLIATLEGMQESNERAHERLASRIDTLRIELSGRIDNVSGRVDALATRMDRLIETTGGHWRDLERRVIALEDKVFEE